MNQSCFSPRFVACARITAALVLFACVVATSAQSDNPAFAKFKREMMPKVGQKITVVGTWSDRTKQCCWLAFNNCGAFVYAGGIRHRERKSSLCSLSQWPDCKGHWHPEVSCGTSCAEGRYAKRAGAFLLRCRRGKNVPLGPTSTKESEKGTLVT